MAPPGVNEPNKEDGVRPGNVADKAGAPPVGIPPLINGKEGAGAVMSSASRLILLGALNVGGRLGAGGAKDAGFPVGVA